MRMRLMIAAAATVLAAGSAQAELSGAYVGAGALGIYQGDRDVRGAAVGTLDTSLGYGGNGYAGYQFSSGFRVEGEVAYRRNPGDRFNNANIDGALTSWALMGNVLWEYDNESGIYPYVGGGLGGAWVSAKNFSNLGGAGLDDSDMTLAMQGIAGVAFALSPNLSLTAEYRYFRTADAELTNAANARVSVDYSAHSAQVGLRYRFGAAPASAVRAVAQPAALPAVTRTQPPRRIARVAPKPAPLPVAQAKAAASLRRTYVVYFGLNRSDLTPEARRTIGEASSQAKTDGTAVIELAGHADRSGDARYNQALSQRRAETTANEIRRNGVQSQLIVKAYGESIPQVPTADGAYEPRNRRVEVVLQGKGDGVSN